MEKVTFKPDEPVMWKILNAGHIGFPKIVEEYVDNSISAGAKTILIRLTQESENGFRLEVADRGCGFPVNALGRVFGVGHAPKKSDPAGEYNLYGIGLKSALATCDPENASWELYSSVGGDTCLKVSAPYDKDNMSCTMPPRSTMPTPKEWGSASGTLISVPVSRALFRSCALRAANDQERIETLVEELRVTYALRLKSITITLEWIPLAGKPKNYPLQPLHPVWAEGSIVDREEVVDFGSGQLLAHYSYGRIEKMDTKRYYKGNITSSGLMVFLDGRLIEFNLFDEVWNQPHPQFNNFLFQVDLRTLHGDRDALPAPRPEKDQLLLGDSRFDALTQWVRRLCPNPREFVRKTQEKKERLLCKMLDENLTKTGAAEYTTMELSVLDGYSKAARSDLYARMSGGKSVLYEAKTGGSKIQDVAQLATYCLMAAESGLELEELVLVAEKHSEPVRKFFQDLLRRWYRDLKVPSTRCLTWAEVEDGCF